MMLVLLTHIFVCRCFVAGCLRQLHRYRCCQCATGKYGQPQQHQYRNEFFGESGHGRQYGKVMRGSQSVILGWSYDEKEFIRCQYRWSGLKLVH